jgi:hypothetical protein
MGEPSMGEPSDGKPADGKIRVGPPLSVPPHTPGTIMAHSANMDAVQQLMQQRPYLGVAVLFVYGVSATLLVSACFAGVFYCFVFLLFPVFCFMCLNLYK